MRTKTILMAAVTAGGDRQTLHEAIRQHSLAAGARVKDQGLDNDLLARLAADPLFAAVRPQLRTLCDPARFVGRAPQQVEEFLLTEVAPIVTRHQAAIAAQRAEVRV